MKIIDGNETLHYLMSQVKNGKRIVYSRYGDGEYLLMTKKRLAATEVFEVGDLLNKSVCKKGQFVCTVMFRKTYEELLEISSRWANTQKYIMKIGNHELYGTGSFLRKDFLNKCELLPYFFKKDVLIVTGHAKKCEEIFKREHVDISVFEMPISRASSEYKEAKKHLVKKCQTYNNIIFCCGPIGKVLISDLIDECESNLIDLGSIINVILSGSSASLKNMWTISWAKNINSAERCRKFFDKLRSLK